MRSKVFYHPELDALRFFAFLLVFLAHGGDYVIDWNHLSTPVFTVLFAIHGAGFNGVDLFFVLSAYLITELLLREGDRTGTIHLPQFYMRRILRIWPLYFFFFLVIRPLVGRIIPTEHLSNHALAAFLLLAGNWHCALYGWPPSIASAMWSVTVEEQFYVVWPALLKWLRPHLVTIVKLLFLIANLARLYLVHSPKYLSSIWCNTFARLDPFAWGILLAWWMHPRENRLTPGTRWQLAGLAAALLLFVGFYGDHTDWRSLFGYPLAGLACVLLLFAVLRPQGDWTPGPVGRCCIYLGRISYGLYVYHLVALEVVSRLPSRPPVITLALAMALTVTLAAISYRLLELPFLRLKERFALVRSRDTLITSTH